MGPGVTGSKARLTELMRHGSNRVVSIKTVPFNCQVPVTALFMKNVLGILVFRSLGDYIQFVNPVVTGSRRGMLVVNGSVCLDHRLVLHCARHQGNGTSAAPVALGGVGVAQAPKGEDGCGTEHKHVRQARTACRRHVGPGAQCVKEYSLGRERPRVGPIKAQES